MHTRRIASALLLIALQASLSGCAAVADLALTGGMTYNAIHKSTPASYNFTGTGHVQDFLALARQTGIDQGARAKQDASGLTLTWPADAVSLTITVDQDGEHFQGLALSMAVDSMTWTITDPVRAIPSKYFAHLQQTAGEQVQLKWSINTLQSA